MFAWMVVRAKEGDLNLFIRAKTNFILALCYADPLLALIHTDILTPAHSIHNFGTAPGAHTPLASKGGGLPIMIAVALVLPETTNGITLPRNKISGSQETKKVIAIPG